MTARTRDKTAARSLAALTGAPYQSCLTAVSVLRAVPAEFDLATFASVVCGRPSAVALPLTLRDDDINGLERSWGPPGQCWANGDAVVVPSSPEDVVIFVPLSPDGIALADGLTLYAEVYLGCPPVRPGLWRVDSAALARAVNAADHRRGQNSTLELWARDAGVFAPPAEIRDTYLSDHLRSAEPYATSPGPGFDWIHLRFADLDLVDEREHHGDDNCPDGGECGFLHDWPTADPDRHELVIPDILLSIWRVLAAADPEPLDNESASYREEGSLGQPSWFGLDLPHGSTLWMRTNEAAG